jgi:hypothetical protein
MTIAELARRLEAEGCRPESYAIGARGSASDAFCLAFDGDQWRIYYTERGTDAPPIYTSADKEAACDWFFRLVMSQPHNHLVGFFRAAAAAQALRARLVGHGIASTVDRIPYGGMHDPRFRVFVPGKAIFPARQVLGALPITDDGE